MSSSLSKKPWATMAVGEEFLVSGIDFEKVRRAAQIYETKLGRKFEVEQLAVNVRVRRVRKSTPGPNGRRPHARDWVAYFKNIKVGANVLILGEAIQEAQIARNTVRKMFKRRFITRSEEGGLRIWRVR